MNAINAWGAQTAGARLAPMTIERREPGPRDVVIEIMYCGVCHSDIHQARDEWTGGLFPMVPGHEIVGRVTRMGAQVTKFEEGALAGVGCLVDSCGQCEECTHDREQFCERSPAVTYNGTEMDRKTRTWGGYSTQIVVDERFAVRIPAGLDPAAAAPLLCAGITTWTPLREFGVKPGQRVGVVGLGGLGHLAVKLAVSMGARVTVLSTSPSKEADARKLGATDFSVAKTEGFDKLQKKLDLIIDTVSAPHDYDAYLGLLKPGGRMTIVGVPPEKMSISAFTLIGGQRQLTGSMIGGIAETQAMLEHCAKHSIVSDIELISIEQINEAYERVLKSDVRYRFVVDLASLRKRAKAA
ncbi:MAG: NAD(P)-dependent alcohol dehydrogenase [Archangium sp.]